MKEQRFYYREDFELESGQILPGFELAYASFGEIQYDAQGRANNVIWICHALTANARADDWWEGLVGSGKLFDPQEHFIICANMLGSCYGSTSALSINPQTQSPFYHDFPQITIRDIVASLNLLRTFLKIDKIKVCIGGSMGGQQALEWAIMCPNIFDQLIVMATNARHSPWGIAFNEAQRMAIEADSSWQDCTALAGLEGMKAARAMALLSYRNYATYEATQLDDQEVIDNFRASSYQQYQGHKLSKRFNAWAYWYLSKAMDSHQVGRGRQGAEQALARIRAKTLVISISSDVLFPPQEQAFLAANIPYAQYEEVDSLYGHDGFLIEHEAIGDKIRSWQTHWAMIQE